MRLDLLATIASSAKRRWTKVPAALHESRRIKVEMVDAEYPHLFQTCDPMIGMHVGMPCRRRAASRPIEAAPRPMELVREQIPQPLPTIALFRALRRSVGSFSA